MHNTRAPSPKTTRRDALRVGGLAALAAGLLGITQAPVAHASTSTGHTPRVIVIASPYLANASRAALAIYRRRDAEVRAAQDAFAATLPEGHRRAFRKIEDDTHGACDALMDMLVAELARHLPGAAPVFPLLWEHVLTTVLDDVGACCTDA